MSPRKRRIDPSPSEVERRRGESTESADASDGDTDSDYVPTLSIAGLGPKAMTELARAIREAEKRAKRDRHLVEAYRDPKLLRDTFMALHQVYGGENAWFVGDDRRLYLTNAATGETITDGADQPISVGKTQLLFAASMLARHRAELRMAEGGEDQPGSSPAIISRHTPLLENRLNRVALEDVEKSSWAGDDFALRHLKIAFGVLLARAGTSITVGADTFECGQGDDDGSDGEEPITALTDESEAAEKEKNGGEDGDTDG